MAWSDRRRSAVAVWLLLAALVVPAARAEPIDVKGFYILRAAGRLDGSRTPSELLHSLTVQVTSRRGPWRVVGIGRARAEGRLEPEPYRELDLRELYLERNSRHAAVRIGRQQVVWGKTDGLRLLDVVNPLDLREFLLEDYEQSRIPLWMVDAEWFAGDQSLQLLVIPDVRFNRRPDPRGEFGVRPDVPADRPARVAPVSAPGSAPRNWELGGRWRTRLGRLELGLHGFYGWLDDPVPFLRPVADGEPPGSGIEVTPEPRRLRLVGAAGDLPVGPVVVRFESTLTPDDYRATPHGFRRQETVRSAVGVDWTTGGLLVSPQLFYRRVVDRHGTLSGDDSRLLGTLVLRKELLRSELALRLFAAYEPDADQYWLSPRVTYQAGGQVELSLGADLFGGETGSTFGRFADRDRLVAQITAYF